MAYFVYVIKSLGHNYIYKGITKNPNERLDRHNSGRERTTRPYRPFELICVEEYGTREKARKREKYLKSGSGRELIKTIVQADVAELADAQP